MLKPWILQKLQSRILSKPLSCLSYTVSMNQNITGDRSLHKAIDPLLFEHVSHHALKLMIISIDPSDNRPLFFVLILQLDYRT